MSLTAENSMAADLRLIDSHCHLHDTEFFADNREELYQQTIAAGIGMICVGTDERSSRQAVEFAANRDYTWATVGVHPHDSKDGWNEVERLLKARADNSPIVAIGEIGLDYYYNHSPRNVQIQALEAQLQLAVDYDLPVSFHIRDGAAGQVSVWDDFWSIFDNFHGLRGVLHSFTDTRLNLEKGFARGLYVGLNGISTFTKDQAQRELFASIPLERLLLETDAPFLTPKPFRGKMNMPRYVELVAKYWADNRNILFDDLSEATVRNTKNLFGI
jgi:hypothetical protein